MDGIKTLGLLGTGVIGAGWAARAIHCGIDVIAADFDPAMERWLRDSIANAQHSLFQLTEGIPLPCPGTLVFTTNPQEMAEKSDFIQESVSEIEDLKIKALQPVAEAADKNIVISSSTSGFLPSDLQKDLLYPERFLVGHPFNPVYLCPLVEIVGGKLTKNEAKAIAREFYETLGMQVLMVNREVPAHISNRLQEAMWREILHMLNEGVATTRDLDESIVYGPGLRWAVMGMNQLYMMAGGDGGARKFMEKFGPTLTMPWCNMDGPELTEDLLDKFDLGTHEQAGGKSIRELEAIRDECMVAIQKVLARHDFASGQTLNTFRARMAGQAETKSS